MNLTRERLQAIRDRHLQHAKIKLFVETGTWKGATTRLARELFPLVHTIESTSQVFEAAVKGLASTDIRCHFGDSPAVLRELLPRLKQPAVFYLDAHWWNNKRVDKKNPFPLWQEIEVLVPRPYADVIIVDDVHDFGHAAQKAPVDEWAEVGPDSINARLDPSRILEGVTLYDQYVVYRKGETNQ